MKKIFYIDQQSYSNLAIYDHSLLSAIAKETPDFQIEYWGNRKYEYMPLPEGINPHWIYRYSDCRNKILSLLSYIFSSILLLVNLLIRRPDVVHLQWVKIFQMDYLILWAAKKICKSHVVFTAHNIVPHNSGESAKKSYGKIYKNADTVIVHTETSLSDFTNMFPDYSHKAKVVPHGLLPNKFTQEEILARANEIRTELNLPEGTRVFSMLGYQSYYKGTDIVCNAWNSSKTLTEGNFILLVAGRCAQDIIPEGCAANVIVINRFISDLDFLGYLNMTDVLLLPYRAIDQSGLLLTAFESSIPVCVSNVGELGKPLEDAKVGWMFDSLECQDVRKMIETLADNPQEIDQVKAAEEDWNKVREMYGWTESAKLTKAIYNEEYNS